MCACAVHRQPKGAPLLGQGPRSQPSFFLLCAKEPLPGGLLPALRRAPAATRRLRPTCCVRAPTRWPATGCTCAPACTTRPWAGRPTACACSAAPTRRREGGGGQGPGLQDSRRGVGSAAAGRGQGAVRTTFITGSAPLIPCWRAGAPPSLGRLLPQKAKTRSRRRMRPVRGCRWRRGTGSALCATWWCRTYKWRPAGGWNRGRGWPAGARCKDTSAAASGRPPSGLRGLRRRMSAAPQDAALQGCPAAATAASLLALQPPAPARPPPARPPAPGLSTSVRLAG